MCPDERNVNNSGKGKHTNNPHNLINIDHLEDLELYTEDIIAKFNADKQLALLAVVDPIGVLREFGYTVSPKVRRELQRLVPRLTRAERDRYLNWLRSLDEIPKTINIKLVPRPSGRNLLHRALQQKTSSGNPGPKAGKGAAGFDIVTQYSEGFCGRLLKRHYEEGRLPRSIYRVSGKLYYFLDSQHYQENSKYLGDADREIHLYLPSLKFVPESPDSVQVTSQFAAIGFGSEEIRGTVTAVGTLVLRKDKQGHPQYIEVSYDNLKSNNVTISFGTKGGPPTALKNELNKIMLEAHRDFRKLFKPSEPDEPHTPITFALVDSSELVKRGITSTPITVTFSIRKPAGAPAPLLVVGLNRPIQNSSGNLNAVSNYIKQNGDFALVQDSVWLEQMMNKGVAKMLPTRFNADTGEPEEDGDVRIDSIVWHYRKDGITGNVAGIQENVIMGIWDSNIDGKAYMDIKFHSSEPTITIEGYTDFEGMACWEKILLVIGTTLIGVAAGGLIGGAVGGILGGLGVGISIEAAIITGAILGGLGGMATGLYLTFGNFEVTPEAMPPTAAWPKKQPLTLKVTREEDLPEGGTVTLVPNSYGITELGTKLSAQVLGPAVSIAKPYVNITGSHSVKWHVSPTSHVMKEPSVGDSTTIPVELPLEERGIIALHYFIYSIEGLQGKLSYEWLFNKTLIGTSDEVSVDVPIPISASSLQFNKPNVLGVISLTVTDSFGRTVSDAITITIGSVTDLRAFNPVDIKMPSAARF